MDKGLARTPKRGLALCVDANEQSQSALKKELPKVSIVIPTYNEESNVARCLKAVFDQDYPTGRIEVFVVDGGSTDRTVEIAAAFPVVCLFNAKRLAEPAKILGLTHSTGDLFLYLDADLFLARKDWLQRLVRPLMEDPTIVGSFTRFIPAKSDPPLNRYLSYHEFHLDPLLEFICYPLDKTFQEDRSVYRICRFEVGKTPPVGICIYRRELLRQITGQIPGFEWVDIAIPSLFARRGYDRFAYVADAGMYHLTVRKIQDLLKQKRRDATVTFLPAMGKREMTYIDFGRRSEIVRLVLWTVYANLFLPSLVRSIGKSLKYRDWACLYETIVTPLITDYVVWLFLRDPHGRRLIQQVLRDTFRLPISI